MILATLAVIGAGTWGLLALWFQAPGGPALRGILMLLWAVLAVTLLSSAWRGHPAVGFAGFALALGVLVLWWLTLRPSNDRDWAPDVARTAMAEVRGEELTVHDVRDFNWRTDHDFDVRWETRHYDLGAVRTLDMVTSYWESPAIAHVIFSFGFADGQQLAFSVEIRRESHEQYNEIGGFFKEFELSIIAADERDVIRVRTNVRGEDDYLYRVRLPQADIRALLLAYVQQMNALARTPRFYNTITVNCTTLVYHMMQRIVGRLPFSYRVLFSGYLPGYVYEVGGLDTRYPLAELKRLGRITERARAADARPDFSAAIRAGIPPLP
ncbi:MAG: DUF4105 domain-containing protein [Proteobacteria bacterium]|nr:DUF4105 domain-containing protein [Pseudomonadota bacterium]